MVEIGYNIGVNHIKSDGLLAQHRHHFSTYVRGVDTMIDYIISPDFVQLVEQHPHFFLSLLLCIALSLLMIVAVIVLLVTSLPVRTQVTYHYYGTFRPATVKRTQSGPLPLPKFAQQMKADIENDRQRPWATKGTSKPPAQVEYDSYSTPAMGGKRERLNNDLRFRVFARDDFRCQICGRKATDDNTIELHIDHRFPYSKGGKNNEKNLWTLCSDCNLGKSDKIVESLLDGDALPAGDLLGSIAEDLWPASEAPLDEILDEDELVQ